MQPPPQQFAAQLEVRSDQSRGDVTTVDGEVTRGGPNHAPKAAGPGDDPPPPSRSLWMHVPTQRGSGGPSAAPVLQGGHRPSALRTRRGRTQRAKLTRRFSLPETRSKAGNDPGCLCSTDKKQNSSGSCLNAALPFSPARTGCQRYKVTAQGVPWPPTSSRTQGLPRISRWGWSRKIWHL